MRHPGSVLRLQVRRHFQPRTKCPPKVLNGFNLMIHHTYVNSNIYIYINTNINTNINTHIQIYFYSSLYIYLYINTYIYICIRIQCIQVVGFLLVLTYCSWIFQVPCQIENQTNAIGRYVSAPLLGRVELSRGGGVLFL